MATKSGESWVGQFPGSRSVDTLEASFRSKVKEFLRAIDAAGAVRTITATLRPPERAFLMHWCWRIVKRDFDPQSVPARQGIDIDWWHGDHAASLEGAREMVHGYGIVNLGTSPAINSRHTEGKAIDMKVEWAGTLSIRDASGAMVDIITLPRDSTNEQLIAVAKTYGVIHFEPAGKDRPHWSTDGR